MMTEQEWLACEDPGSMLKFLRDAGKLSERKARLFAVACCWEVVYLLRDKRSRRAVRTAELYADGLVTPERMAAARQQARRAVTEWVSPGATAVGQRFAEEVAHAVALESAGQAAADAAELAARVSEAEAREPGYQARQQSQSVRLRDFFSPFRPATIDPSWLTTQAVTLAHTIYAERSFDHLPVLADALEDAGCTDAELLGHLRGEGMHVKGCFALDAILGNS